MIAKKLLALAALSWCATAVEAQTVEVPFDVNAQGKSLPINWGMDTAWDDLYNVNWGIAHYGANFQTGRISFQPYELVDASKIDDASANFGLPLKMARKLQQRIDRIKLTGTTKVAINNDHEVLTRAIDANGNYAKKLDKQGNPTTEDSINNLGKKNYVPTSIRTNTTFTTRWVNLIKASVKYAQAQGLEVVSAAPFNEPDYGWYQYYNGTPGTNTTNQQSYGMRDFLAIAKAIKADPFFATGAGKNVRICGPNTLNCDRALPWYNYTGMAAVIDEGNTHQLSGSFDNYATFFKTISDAGKVATADELHNVGEALVGVEYGMQNGIWWAFDAKARGQFMHDSNEGVRLGYAEDRSHWTSAAVYRNNQDGEIHGFIGSSERQANVSTYKFVSQGRDVYFNGYGPQREWSVTTVGGAKDSYQNGQINYEYLFDITYGEDVQSAPVNGNYQIMSAYDKKLITSNANPNDVSCNAQVNNNTQRWHIYPDNIKAKGDCSYWFIDNLGDANQHLNLRDGNLNAGAKVLTYNAGHDALEQWYFRYAKDGYFYIMTRQSNKYLYNNNGSISVQEGPTSRTSAQELKKYMWRLMPTDATAENVAPAVPAGLTATASSSSVSLTWNAVSEAKVTYNVLRRDADGWNTIARCISETSFVDESVEEGAGYLYKVQAVDYSGNRSEASATVNVFPGESNEAAGEGRDMTSLIVNPTILQSGTTNDAPRGWTGAKTNVTGNGHWTEGTGDTRLEAWSWLATLNADYYQEVIVPNGLYTLSALTHQRANGNAALYGETYKSFETIMPVGDGNEARIDVENILVTNGVIKIGAKVSGVRDEDQWMTADDFALTYFGVPSDLTHYTNAIAYLNGIAAEQFARNIDTSDLQAAYEVANNCDATVSAYEKAINDYVAAIKRAQAMPEAVLGETTDVTSGDWIGATGNYQGDAAERYNWDNPYQVGRILYQVIEDLVPGATYEIQFYAVANVARNLNAAQYSGSGIAYLFANNTEEDIDVIYQDACTINNYPRTLTAVADENGQIAYGIANRKAGGQWYVAKAKSITCLGIKHTATLSVRANAYGTFVAPYDVTLPAGITAYTVEAVSSDNVSLAVVANEGETLAANTPVIVKNTTDSQVTKDYVDYCAMEKTILGGTLVGFMTSGETIPLGAYVLQTQDGVQSFYKVTSAFTGTKNRCYLAAPAGNSANSRLRISFSDADAIETATDDAPATIVGIFSIDGTKNAAMQRGINIVRLSNGTVKKILVK